MPAGTCSSPTEACVYDETCLAPGAPIGCNAAGHASCRFCGFAQYAECPPFIITVTVEVEGTVETFDRASFKSNLAAFAGVRQEAISLQVRPASVLVTATITVSGSNMLNITNALGSADPMILTTALGVTVQGVTMTSGAVTPPPSAPPLNFAQSTQASLLTGENAPETISMLLIGAIVILGCCILGACACLHSRRRRKGLLASQSYLADDKGHTGHGAPCAGYILDHHSSPAAPPPPQFKQTRPSISKMFTRQDTTPLWKEYESSSSDHSAAAGKSDAGALRAALGAPSGRSTKNKIQPSDIGSSKLGSSAGMANKSAKAPKSVKAPKSGKARALDRPNAQDKGRGAAAAWESDGKACLSTYL